MLQLIGWAGYGTTIPGRTRADYMDPATFARLLGRTRELATALSTA